jgi:hypothetical protein
MGVHNVRSLSIGEWAAICRAWRKSHGDNKPEAPTEDEFDAAIMRARGIE